MAEPSEAEATGPVSPGIEAAVYIDASALAKLYVPEAESERLDTFLCGRLGLMISELAITEVLSAVARRKREGELRPELANQIRGALLADADSGSFARLHWTPRCIARRNALCSPRTRCLYAMHYTSHSRSPGEQLT